MKNILIKFAEEAFTTDKFTADGKVSQLQRDTNLIGSVNNILNVVLGLLGIVSVVVIIIGGFTYMTSSGDSSKVKKGKDTILYGVIGLVICILAFAIVNFVIANINDNAGSST